MNVKINKTKKNELEVLVEVTPELMKPYLEKAVIDISKQVQVKGFRPGKATYESLIPQVGEMNIWQAAAEIAVPKILTEHLKEHITQVASEPEIEIQKLAPNNVFAFKAVIALLPSVTVGDITKITLKKQKATVTPEDISKIYKQIQEQFTTTVIKNDVAAMKDAVTVDFTTAVDRVMIEHGSQKDYYIRLGDHKMIAGFEEQIVGLKKGDTKKFTLKFPKDYYAKHLANKMAEFDVTVKDVYTVSVPEINDELAKKLQYKDAADLKKNIENRIQLEKQWELEKDDEVKMLEAIIEKSKFDEISPLLIHKETHRMVHDMADRIEKQGMRFADYLKAMKKTEKELELDVMPQAIKRIKSSLVLEKIAETQKLKADDKELEAELQKAKEAYKQSPDMQHRITTPSYRRYLGNVIANNKVLDFLKKSILKD